MTIEKAEIVGPYEMTGRECNHYVYIQFCDGSSISLNEEELKSAAILAGMGRLIENE